MKYLLTINDLLKQTRDWWAVRAWVIALDRDRMVGPVSLSTRIFLRRN